MKKIIKIAGMQCDKCASRVKDKLENIELVDKVNVSIEKKEAYIEFQKEIDNEILKDVIDNLGYEVISIRG